MKNNCSSTCETSKDDHIDKAISGDLAKAASVSKIQPLRDVGIEQPIKPNNEMNGSHAGSSQMVILATSSCHRK